jgi:adenine-specific DNA-methyltransferase
LASTPTRQPAATFTLENRKYIGSKTRLLPFLVREIERRVPDFVSFGDLFAGTGVVGHAFARAGKRVVAVDNLLSNYVGLVTFLCPEPERAEGLARRVALLNALEPVAGYCHAHFGGTYFTFENAGRIDAVREQIAAWHAGGEISDYEHAALLAALIYAVDKAANTVGQYDAYLKHLGGPPYDEAGRHLVDTAAHKRLQLLPPALDLLPGAHGTQAPGEGQAQEPGAGSAPEADSPGAPAPGTPGHGPNRAICGDAEVLVGQLAVDVLYLDPPYNSRQYVDNYHVLENIARWEKPPVYGRTRKFERRALKSRFSSRRSVREALAGLIASARAPHIFLSYNSEGLLSRDEILALLGDFGPVEVTEADYAVFGNGAGVSRKRKVVERLYYLQKR